MNLVLMNLVLVKLMRYLKPSTTSNLAARSKSAARLLSAPIVCLMFSLTLPTAQSAEKQVGPFKHQAIPGGIAIVNTGVSSEQSVPTVKLGKKQIAVLEDNGQWHAIVGIALSTQFGTHQLNVSSANTTSTIEFSVGEFSYEEQRIVIKDKSKVNPAPLDMKRIKKENKRLAEVKAYRYGELLSDKFQLPLEGILTSPFGLRRFYNDQPRRPHGGIDIAADTGTPIYAPATGLVVETGDYFFNGNCVFIEHGLGLQTFYAHMDKIHVKAGDKVYAGDLIGEVGATGRVTGPHLHWSVGLNGTWIDPGLLLDD